MNNRVAKRIREARLQHGLTQLQLAQEIGYETATKIAFMESGTRAIKVADLEKIAHTLKRNVTWFVGKYSNYLSLSDALWADDSISDEDKRVIWRVIELASNKN